jgi:arsenate reductase
MKGGIAVMVVCLALVAYGVAQGSIQSESKQRQLVFVCEHGAALSVISAAYFNKLAKEQHLNVHAVARGVTPQENLSVQATAGLKNDGLAPEIQKPLALSRPELDSAERVITFFPLPDEYATSALVESWDDVTWRPGSYEKSRNAILKHMQKLLDRIKAGKK